MAQWQDFFAMSRHERRGTIALLALIAVMLAATALWNRCEPASDVGSFQADMEQFEQQIDSMQPAVRPAHRRHDPTRHRRPAARKDKPSKPHRQRQLEPVPQL